MAKRTFSARTLRIAELNDAHRRNVSYDNLSDGLIDTFALPVLSDILKAVRKYSNFTLGSDYHGEHDFGTFDYMGERVLWKIDCYDLTKTRRSPDAANPAVTCRILSVFLAEEV